MKVLKDFSYEKACCNKMNGALYRLEEVDFDKTYGVFYYSPKKNGQFISIDKCPFCGEEIKDANETA